MRGRNGWEGRASVEIRYHGEVGGGVNATIGSKTRRNVNGANTHSLCGMSSAWARVPGNGDTAAATNSNANTCVTAVMAGQLQQHAPPGNMARAHDLCGRGGDDDDDDVTKDAHAHSRRYDYKRRSTRVDRRNDESP